MTDVRKGDLVRFKTSNRTIRPGSILLVTSVKGSGLFGALCEDGTHKPLVHSDLVDLLQRYPLAR